MVSGVVGRIDWITAIERLAQAVADRIVGVDKLIAPTHLSIIIPIIAGVDHPVEHIIAIKPVGIQADRVIGRILTLFATSKRAYPTNLRPFFQKIFPEGDLSCAQV